MLLARDRMSDAEIEQVCERFEAEWVAGHHPRMESFLQQVESSEKPGLLSELLQIEWWWVARTGPLDLGDYQRRFAQHRSTVLSAWDAFHRRSVAETDNPSAGSATEKSVAKPDSGQDETVDDRAPTRSLADTDTPRTRQAKQSSVSVSSRLGPYELVERLGQGGFGQVWKANRIGKLATTQVAIKIPRDSLGASRILQAEAQSWTRATGHPNVVPIIEADIYDDVVAIVSEYVADGTLADVIKRQPIAIADALEFAIGVLNGLAFLHSKQIIHRDLKPANILLQHGIPRLVDFGLAQVSQSDLGHVAGTPSYMAPEAFDGVASVKSDLWSAGIVLFEMITGRHPFAADDSGQLIARICSSESVAIPDDVPDMIGDVILHSLQKKPSDRYGSASEMRADLSNCRRRLTSWDLSRQSTSTPRHLAIAVTGSMDADPQRVSQRLKPILGRVSCSADHLVHRKR